MPMPLLAGSPALDAFISRALSEDTGPGDYSTLCCIPPGARGRAVLLVKESGILAGVEIARAIFQFLDPAFVLNSFRKDGDRVQAGDLAFDVSGRVSLLLQAERLVLNCMQRMSGIATLTSHYVEALQGLGTVLLDTRKTTPNFRMLEKAAVRIGGGQNHRMGLYDRILLKDNHIDFCGGIPPAIRAAKIFIEQRRLDLPIEIETRNLEEVDQVLDTGEIDRIMFDNFSLADLSLAVGRVAGRFQTEASGSITLDNIRRYAASGVDFLSVGALIHHAVSLDLSLKASLNT